MRADRTLPLGADVDTGTTSAGSTAMSLQVQTAAVTQDFEPCVREALAVGLKVNSDTQHVQPYAIHAVKAAPSVSGATENALNVHQVQGVWNTPGVNSGVTNAAGGEVIIAANPKRVAVMFQVPSTSAGRISLAADHAATPVPVLDSGITVAIGDSIILEGRMCPKGPIWGISSVVNGTIAFQEVEED